MSMKNPFEYAIALTGGIASGKSTVASLLRLHGLQCIDADAVAHEILAEAPGVIAELFGAEYLSDGKVDRPKLGSLIFGDKAAKAKLEAYMHPKIRARIEEKAQRFEKLKFPYLIDIPLFYETSAYPIKHALVVYTPKAVQLQRLMKRSKLDESSALQRIESQMAIEAKREKADFVIDNSGDLPHLQAECEAFVEKIKQRELL